MPKFQVEIKETLSLIEEVEADDENIAVGKISHDYFNGGIVLNADNFVTVDIDIYKENPSFADEVRQCIKTLKNFDADVIYTALLLSDAQGINNPTDEECDITMKVTNTYNSLYDETIKETVKKALQKRAYFDNPEVIKYE